MRAVLRRLFLPLLACVIVGIGFYGVSVEANDWKIALRWPTNAADDSVILDIQIPTNIYHVEVFSTDVSSNQPFLGVSSRWQIAQSCVDAAQANVVTWKDTGSVTRARVSQVQGRFYVAGNMHSDQDGDLLSDLCERLVHRTNPLLWDTDSDGASDEMEVGCGLNPLVHPGDRDGDGISDDLEMVTGSSPDNSDSDGDGLVDGYDVTVSEDDSRYQAWVLAGIAYAEDDGQRTFKGELTLGADPLNADTDGDWISDGYESQHWTSPLDESSTPPLRMSINGDALYTGDTNIMLMFPGMVAEDVLVQEWPHGEITNSFSPALPCALAGTVNGWRVMRAQLVRGGELSSNMFGRILFDNQPPDIEMSQPTNAHRTDRRWIRVEGTISDMNMAGVLVNGVWVDGVATGRFWQSRVDLEQGTNQVIVEARDQAGNSSTTTVTVIQDTSEDATAPLLSLDMPRDYTVIDGVTNWMDRTTVGDGKDLFLKGWVDDETAEVEFWVESGTNAYGPYHADILATNVWSHVALQPGTNRVVGLASDAAGNTSTSQWTLIRDADFFFVITFPAPNQILNSPSTIVRGIASPMFLNATITVNGISTAISNAGDQVHFTTVSPVPLARDRTALQAVAKLNGRSYYCDPTVGGYEAKRWQSSSSWRYEMCEEWTAGKLKQLRSTDNECHWWDDQGLLRTREFFKCDCQAYGPAPLSCEISSYSYTQTSMTSGPLSMVAGFDVGYHELHPNPIARTWYEDGYVYTGSARFLKQWPKQETQTVILQFVNLNYWRPLGVAFDPGQVRYLGQPGFWYNGNVSFTRTITTMRQYEISPEDFSWPAYSHAGLRYDWPRQWAIPRSYMTHVLWFDSITNDVIKVDIAETSVFACAGCTGDCGVTLTLTNSHLGSGDAEWFGGPTNALLGTGASVTFNPTNWPPANYTITARSTVLTNCQDTCGLSVLSPRLVPDWNRDKKIDSSDENQAAASNPFRFWKNDDDDQTVNSGNDIPGEGSSDSGDSQIDSVRDLVDFFPVFVDLKDTLDLLGTTDFTYALQYNLGGIGFVYTDLTPANAGDYLADHTTAENLAGETVNTISGFGNGFTLDSAFLSDIQNNGKGIILVEADAASADPLVLNVIDSSDNIICSVNLELSISGVEGMYRHVNLRPDGDGRATETGEPPNYPDTLSPNGKNVFFLHGFNTDGEGARGWHAEVFKRMYWARSNAKFWGVTWEGDLGLVNALHYQEDVANCFLVASNLYDEINSVPNKTVMAHSLGNMVVSAAIEDYGLSVDNYFMLNAAVAIEAYDQAEFDTSTTGNHMVHEDWPGYNTNTWSATWHQLFTAPDDRKKLTWKNRFDSALNNAYNFYSTGDEIFEVYPGTPDSFSGGLFHLEQYAWHKQEIFKGRFGLGSTDEAGWGFSGEYTEAEANAATPDNLRTNAVFRQEPAEMFSSIIVQQTQNEILGLGIPALSGATGRNPIDNIDNYDMEANKASGWPRTGYYADRWLHSDMKNMAYLYTYTLFEKLVSEGGFE